MKRILFVNILLLCSLVPIYAQNFSDRHISSVDIANRDPSSLTKEELNVYVNEILIPKAESGDTEIQYMLCTIYGDGLYGYPIDLEKAVYWGKKAAVQGDARAQFFLSSMYMHGRGGLEKDAHQSFYWCEKSADQGLFAALERMGDYYQYGIGVEKDYKKALYWLEKASRQKQIKRTRDILARMGGIYCEIGNVTKGVSLAKESANKGSAYGQYLLGLCYESGDGVEKNLPEAVKLYKQCIENDNEEMAWQASYNLAMIYYRGKDGIAQNYNEAVKLFAIAAEHNVLNANNYLGECYLNGTGVEKDPAKAVSHFMKDVSNGSGLAAYNLAGCYIDGTGVTQNIGMATNLLIDAVSSENPNPQAVYMLALLMDGAGLYDDAIKLYRQAVALGFTPAQTDLDRLLSHDNVDIDIPQILNRNPNTFAVIIANEHYTQVEKVPYAIADGTTFAAYCEKTLGIPQNNIRIYEDATYGKMLAAISDIGLIAEAYDGDLNIVFYYAGHGAPMEGTQEAYLLPVDSYGAHSGAALSLDDLYSELGKMGARTTTVFLDACFSGASREGGMLASARGVAVKPKEATPTAGNVVVLSAASGEETALPYEEMKHGMFTYYLLKKLKESKGDVTLGELSDYVIQNVRQRSAVVNRKSQTPTVLTSGAVAETWRSIKLAR